MRIGIVAAWVLAVAAVARTADAIVDADRTQGRRVGGDVCGRPRAGRPTGHDVRAAALAGGRILEPGRTDVDARSSPRAFEGGVNLFARPHVGVQILASRSAADLSGANGPYRLDITYVSRQPFDSTPQTFSVHESIPWPDTTGSVSLFIASLNGVVRLGGTDHPPVTASAGLTYGRIGGTCSRLGTRRFE